MINKCFLLVLIISYSFGKLKCQEYGNPQGRAIKDELSVTDVNQMLKLLEKRIPSLEQNISRILEIVSTKKSTELERNIKKQSDDVKKLTELYETMNRQLEVIDKKISQKIEENIHLKLDALATNISELEEKIICKSENIKNVTECEEKKPPKLDEKENKIRSKVSNETLSLNATANKEKTLDEIIFPERPALCKEVSVSGILAQPFSMDNESFKHVTLKRNSSTGQLTNFEMHLAIKADERVTIQLTENENISDSDIRYYIDVGRNNNQYTELQFMSKTLRRIHTPNILSSSELKTFYIKIDHGTLKFGNEGDSSPLISYYDSRFRSLNYFTFGNWVNEAKIRYDCPAPVVVMPCKEERLINYHDTQYYSMDNETYNNVALERNAAGLLMYFEMKMAIESNAELYFRLTNKGSSPDSDVEYITFLRGDSGQYTEMNFKYTNVLRFKTPNIFSSNQFRTFYIKIDDGTMEFGKEGDSPLISHYDERFKSANYFQFGNYGNGVAKIQFDCPALVEGSS